MNKTLAALVGIGLKSGTRWMLNGISPVPPPEALQEISDAAGNIIKTLQVCNRVVATAGDGNELGLHRQQRAATTADDVVTCRHFRGTGRSDRSTTR